MIYSMTGYANKVLNLSSTLIQLEIKSVNHRFLDINIKSAEEFKPLENAIRNLISRTINRGKIDVKCFIKDHTTINQELHLNQNLMSQYLALINQINQQTHNQTPITASEILNLPGILQHHQLSLNEMEQPLLAAFQELITEFSQTQSTEGNKLIDLLNLRLNAISTIILELKPLLASALQEYQYKLKQRLIDVLGENISNDARLQQEFAFFCQKSDVSEEIDRLSAHTNEFRQLLKQGGAIGKRLDFICQEMHREANTFGAKSIAITTTNKSVDLKVQIEQIREQVQNIM